MGGGSFDIYPDNFWQAFDTGRFLDAIQQSGKLNISLQSVTSDSPFDPFARDTAIEFGVPVDLSSCEEDHAVTKAAVLPSFTYNYDEFIFSPTTNDRIQLRKAVIVSGHANVQYQDYRRMKCRPEVIRTYTSDDHADTDKRIQELQARYEPYEDIEILPVRMLDFDYSFLELQFNILSKGGVMLPATIRLNPDAHLIAGGLHYVSDDSLAVTETEIMQAIRRQVGLPPTLDSSERAEEAREIPNHDYLSRMDVTQARALPVPPHNQILRPVLMDEESQRYTDLHDRLVDAYMKLGATSRGLPVNVVRKDNVSAVRPDSSPGSGAGAFSRTLTTTETEVSTTDLLFEHAPVTYDEVQLQAVHYKKERAHSVTQLHRSFCVYRRDTEMVPIEEEFCYFRDPLPHETFPDEICEQTTRFVSEEVDFLSCNCVEHGARVDHDDFTVDVEELTFDFLAPVLMRNGTKKMAVGHLRITDIQNPYINVSSLKYDPIETAWRTFYPEINLEQAAEDVYQALITVDRASSSPNPSSPQSPGD